MTNEPTTQLDALLQALSAYKQELAKVLTGLQTARERRQRRDLARRLDAGKRRARVLSRDVGAVLAGLDAGHTSRPDLETAAVFLVKVQALGDPPATRTSPEA